MVVWSTLTPRSSSMSSITIADRKHQIPPDPLALPFHPAAPDGTFGKSRPQDHLSGELPAFEGLILTHLSRLSPFRHGLASPWPHSWRKAATEPDKVQQVHHPSPKSFHGRLT